MNHGKQKLTLDQPVTYRIQVPGQLDEHWSGWGMNTKVEIACGEGDQRITMLTGTFDQAALHGLLRMLYSLGVPLISVEWIDLE